MNVCENDNMNDEKTKKSQPEKLFKTNAAPRAKTVIFAGGGTAGHIMPFTAVYPELKKRGVNAVYIGSGKQLEKSVMQDYCDFLCEITPPKFIRGFSFGALKNFLLPAELLRAVKQAEQILNEQKPRLVFSKGGYCALPVCLAAFKLRVPVICHESDLSIGLANKLCLKKCDKFLCTFSATAKKYGGECIGSPMREELFKIKKSEALKYFGLPNDKPVLLISGGSQGSKIINEAVQTNLKQILKRFNVLHAVGKGNKCAYKPVNGYFAFEFINMANALSAADFCLIRGGSNTLFEVLYAKKPSVCVPLKKGSRGDQIKNAEHFEKLGALISCDENELKPALPDLLNDLINRQTQLKSAITALDLKNGTPELCKIILSYF